MSINPGRPYQPAGLQQPQSNKKLWIILGSVIGVLVIAMGGCVACAALLGWSAMKESERASTNGVTGSSADAPRATSRPRAGTRGANTLAGSWGGTLSCDNGEQMPATFRVAETGNPVYEYETKTGMREAELTSAGQTLRFVPPEGGVTSVTVESLSVTPGRISYAMSISGERSGGGTLDQSRASVQAEVELAGAEADVRLTLRSQSVMSQPGIVVPGDESAAVCRGKLRRQ